MQQDYYSGLASVITAAAARDNPQMRRTIYELARNKLRRQLDWEIKEFGHADRAQKLRALEAAIEQIEADLARNISRHTYSGPDVIPPIADSPIEIIPPARHLPPRYEFAPEQTARHTRSLLRSALALAGAAVLGAAVYIAVERRVYEMHQPSVQTDQNPLRKGISNGPPDMPIPSAYGVYALTNGKLTELEPLPIKVLDHAVAMSAMISTASKTKLPDGRIRFIVFKRDLVNNAPERVVVRVVAQVTRTPELGRNQEATTASLADWWAIRGIAYEMKVAPVEGNPAMIVIRPADNSFSFPPGRYALVLKTVAYDFSVDGPVTDLAQ